MTQDELVDMAAKMYWGDPNAAPESLPPKLRTHVLRAREMIAGTPSPNWDNGRSLRSTQVLAAIVSAYQMIHGLPAVE